VHTWTSWADERPLQVQADDAVAARNRSSTLDGGVDLLARAANQGRQAACRSIAPMCASNCSQRLGRGIVVEKESATTVDLQIDKARRQNCPSRQAALWPIGGKLDTRADIQDAASSDQYNAFDVPTLPVKNPVC
jgi:hypothetical protein